MSNAPDAASANPYDVVPYRDFPYAFTHPRALETLAVLFGMEPPPIDRCRVLELGCAGGGNLIPQAIDLPGSTFLGIDLSQRQVEGGQQIIAELGLENIVLRQADILAVDESWGQFDYILAHGVFSWVPYEVQETLLEIGRRNLAPNGVAFVSYNTYPGWHLAGIVRDLVKFHAGGFREPAKQIEQCHAILEFLAQCCNTQQAAGLLLKEELDLFRKVSNDTYLFHEYLEPNNHPVYFHEFAGRAAAHGLQYLADADFSMMLLQNMPEKVQEAFRKVPLVQQEQYMDFVRGRRFRKTLLCHEDVPLKRDLSSAQIKRFHVAAADKIEVAKVDIRNEQPAEFRSGGATLSAASRLVKAALVHLKEIHPRFVPFPQLHATALARAQLARPTAAEDPTMNAESLAGALMRGYAAGMIAICLHPPRAVSEAGQRPRVGPLARLQAARGRQLTNASHQTVALDPLAQRVVRRLDGKHDRAALLEAVREAMVAGEVVVKGGDGQVRSPEDTQTLGQVLEITLGTIARSGLLVG